MDISFDQFNNALFSLYSGNPVIRRHGLSPLVADPSVITPEESHDGRWHLACHTIFGVELYSSSDGFEWIRSGKVVGRAMRADLKRINGTYYLFYEHLAPFVKKLFTLFFGNWHSDIYCIKSSDLANWSAPVKILGNDISYAADSRGRAVSNPFLFQDGNEFRLYFSAGQTFLEDCGFCEPTFISCADSSSPDGPYVSRTCPVISPSPDEKWRNLCCGCIKVYRLKDCFIGIQNGIYKDSEGNSKSAIVLLRSPDGIHFDYVRELLSPQLCPDASDPGWMNQFVYASTLSLSGGRLRLYFNARNCADVLHGRENIGLYISDPV